MPSVCVYPLATNRVLHISIEPSTCIFILYTHSHHIALLFGGNDIMTQMLLAYMAYNSVSMV